MKRSILGMCTVAVLLWVCAGAQAQGQGKGQGGGDKERAKERSPQSAQAQEKAPASEVTAEKNAGKGKAAKPADEGAAKQGKKGQAPTDKSDKGKGKSQEKQAQALQKQQQHEQAKHMERVAKLNRIRELAVKKGDTEMVARVDKLIAKEQEVYARKQGRGPGQGRAAGTAGPSDMGAGKGKSTAAEQKGKSGKQAEEGVKEQKNEAKPDEGEK